VELPRQDSFGELTAGVPALHSATNGRIRRKRYGTTGPRRGCRRGLSAFGSGTLSSSDGQKFPVKGKSLTAAHLSRYFARGQGVSAYTHVSDQHSTYAAKVIAATSPESPNVLDGILGNQTDLPATEHATDTHGATLANFALFDLVDFQFSPRIRDLGKITLYRPGPRADFTARYPAAGHLLTRRLNENLITGMWDDLLRVAASVKGGHTSAALVVGKPCSSKRQQNALASAIKEYGALRRTVLRPLPRGRNLQAADRAAAEQGREPARAQAAHPPRERPLLRHPRRRRRRRTRPARRRRVPAAAQHRAACAVVKRSFLNTPAPVQATPGTGRRMNVRTPLH
jgi:hypothetical protein